MSRPCKRCRECDEHCYWNHMDDQEKYFFKIMIGDFRHRMIIPENFAINFRGQISEVVNLELPNGNKFNVQVTKEGNRLVFRSGWDAFCSAHDLREGDFLVFRYNGSSSFKVLIFDPSGCQKVLSCYSGPDVQERSSDDDDSVEILGASCYHPMQSPRSERLARRRSSRLNASRKATSMTSAFSPSQRSDVPPSEDTQVNSGGIQSSIKPHYVLARQCNLTSAQMAKVDVVVRKIQPAIPFFVAVMNKTNICSSTLVISNGYAVEHLPRKDETITLCLPGSSKKWDVNFKIARHAKYALFGGWKAFVRSNGLQEGDVCIFEVSKRERSEVTMTVHILPETSHHHLSGGIKRGFDELSS